MSIQSFFKTLVDVGRPRRVDDDMGNWTTTYDPLHVKLACSLQPRRGFEGVSHDKLQSEVTHVMYCNVVDLLPSDRVTMGSGDTMRKFDILIVRDIVEYGRFLTVDMKEVVED